MLLPNGYNGLADLEFRESKRKDYELTSPTIIRTMYFNVDVQQRIPVSIFGRIDAQGEAQYCKP